jgi:hypothetical protein
MGRFSLGLKSCLFVIPAKAGIHAGSCHGLVLALHLHWIGMYFALM